MWRGAEMKAVWDRVDAQIKENGGNLLQPTGVWEQDYDTILEELLKEQEKRNEQQRKADEEQQRSNIRSTEGGWRAIVDGFAQRNVPGVRLIASKRDDSVTVALAKAGMVFNVHTVGGTERNGVPDWQVSSKGASGQSQTKVEKSIVDCLNARPQQWNLAHLLVSSHADFTGYSNSYISGYDIFLLQHQANSLHEMRQDDRRSNPTPDNSPVQTHTRPSRRAAAVFHLGSLSCQLHLINHPSHIVPRHTALLPPKATPNNPPNNRNRISYTPDNATDQPNTPPHPGPKTATEPHVAHPRNAALSTRCPHQGPGTASSENHTSPPAPASPMKTACRLGSPRHRHDNSIQRFHHMRRRCRRRGPHAVAIETSWSRRVLSCRSGRRRCPVCGS